MSGGRLGRCADARRAQAVRSVAAHSAASAGTSCWIARSDGLRCARCEARSPSSSISGAVLWADGTYSSGPGARIQARDTFGTTAVGLGWRSYWYDQKDYGGDDSEISQHSLFGSVDVPLSERWDLSFVGDRSIGDMCHRAVAVEFNLVQPLGLARVHRRGLHRRRELRLEARRHRSFLRAGQLAGLQVRWFHGLLGLDDKLLDPAPALHAFRPRRQDLYRASRQQGNDNGDDAKVGTCDGKLLLLRVAHMLIGLREDR